MKTVLREPWTEFRDHSLTVPEVENTRAALANLFAEGAAGARVLELGTEERRFKVYVHISRKLARLDLLGAHFVRKGEPFPGFIEAIGGEVAALKAMEDGYGD